MAALLTAGLARANEVPPEIAERIRALGANTPASYSEFMKMASIKEDTTHPSAMDMIRRLVDDNEKASQQAQKVIDDCEKADDQGTIDLCARRKEAHDKAAWMLRSHLQQR